MNYNYIETLVNNIKNGDEISKVKLIDEFTPYILNVCKKTYVYGYDFCDLKNECYQILFKCISLYKTESHRFVAYATNGIKNSIYDLIKKAKIRSSSEGPEAYILTDNLDSFLPDNGDSFEDKICDKIDMETLQKSINSLNKEEKDLVNFVYFNHKPLTSYAKQNKLSYNNANKKKTLILRKMATHFIPA